jgi:hypothetical protein
MLIRDAIEEIIKTTSLSTHNVLLPLMICSFGFQTEERILWEATKMYMEMSPFMLANRIKKLIFIVQEEEDNNYGTLIMQLE